MENIILRFAEILRNSGMKIAPSEITDALTALAHFGIEEEIIFYQILKATLLKNESDRETFDLAFRLYFRGKPQKLQSKKVPCHSGDIPLKGTAGMSQKAKAFYGAVLQDNGESLMESAEATLEEAEVPQTVEELLLQLKVTLSWFMVENALVQTENEVGLNTLAELERYLRHRSEEKIYQESHEDLAYLLQEENLMEKDLSALNEEQVKAMELRIGKLAKKLAAKYSYRLKPGKNGILDMRKMLSETAKRGYIPGEMAYLNKERNRPRMIVLCDISGSMARYSSFFLQLVYAMERSFEDLHSYLFVDNIVEAKFPRHSNSVQEAIAQTIAEAYVPRTGRTGQHCTTTGISDYGKMFYHFLKKYETVLDDKTTVFIMGDGKNNWFPPNKEDLKTIAIKSKALYWLNPEPKEKWNTEDSIIHAYAPFCKGIYECRTLEQLEKAGRLLH